MELDKDVVINKIFSFSYCISINVESGWSNWINDEGKQAQTLVE